MATTGRATDEARFEVRGALGAGGTGSVHRAFDHRLGREVALKSLRNVTARNLYRFKREFRSLADMAHPNLVTLHELHTTGEDWFFTMELVHGVSFLRWVRPAPPEVQLREEIARVPLDEPHLRLALPQLVEGVMALHAGGKLHRDLKPSNVLVTGEGRVVLLDFGLISEVDTARVDKTHDAMAVGTPAYMSPEQAADLPLTEASDWYAVGVMLYEALTGWRPFEGTPQDLMSRKQREVPARPRDRDPSAPADLDALCMALLQVVPGKRPGGRAILEALGVPPSPALLALERMAATRPFVGRAAERAALDQAFADAADHTVAMFVSGESGIGKTQLVRHFLDGHGGDAIVLEGRCYERESVPYKTLDTLVDALTAVLLGQPEAAVRALLPADVAALARLFPVLRRVPAVAERTLVANLPAMPYELRGRAFAALRELLAGIAARARLVIAIDDLQWGDADSTVFLAQLVHDRESPPVLVILIHRPEDDTGLVRRLRLARPGAHAGDVRAIAVGPLSEGDARELVRATGGSDATSDSVIRDAGGHPLFLAELMRTARGGSGGPASFEDLIARRVEALPAPAATLLRTVAVAARPLPIELAARAAGVILDGSEVALLRAERLVRARHLGELDVAHIEPYHDRVRHAVATSLDAAQLREIHEALARGYEGVIGGRDLEALVAHWMAAGQPGKAAGYAAEAARAAEDALAFHRAVSLYALALAHGELDDGRRRALRRRHAEALANVGRLVEAADEFALAAQGADPDEAFELEKLRLEQLLRRGLLAEGRKLFQRMLAAIGVTLPTSRAGALRALLVQLVRNRLRGLGFVERDEAAISRDELRRVDLLSAAATALGITEPIVGRLLQAHYLRAALDAGEPNRVLMALAIELGYIGQKGDRAQRRIDRVLAVVHALSSRVDSEHARALAAAMEGLMHFLCGRFAQARGLLEEGLGMMSMVPGMHWELSVNQQIYIGTLFYLGEAREIVRLVPELLNRAIDRDDVFAQDGMRVMRGNIAWLIMGRPDEARAHLDVAASPVPAPEDVTTRHQAELIARVHLELYLGHAEAARDRVAVMWPVMTASLMLNVQFLRIEALLLRGRAYAAHAIAAAADERAAALAVVRAAIKVLAGEHTPWASAIAQMFRALVARAEGDLPRAALELERAEPLLVGVDLRLFAWAVRLRRAQLEGGAAGEARAARVLDELRAQGVVDPVALARVLCPWADA